MTRRTLIPTASLVALIAAVGFIATDHARAAEMRVTSSDATARFMALGVSKSVVIDTPTDIKDVLVADKGIVEAVVRSKRRVYVIGIALGQTNVFLFDADGRQIGALDIAVLATSPPTSLENYPFPVNVVEVYRGARGQSISCTPIICVDANKPGADQPPGTQNFNVTGNASALVGTSQK
jgi:hypothetical protein